MSGRKSGGKSHRTIVYEGQSNRFSMILVLIVVAAIFIVVSVRRVSLLQQLDEYDAQIQALEDEIASEMARTEEIEEYAKYVQTDEYVEDIARDKLGLVRDGEILFKNDGDSYSASESAQEDSEETADSEDADTSGSAASDEDAADAADTLTGEETGTADSAAE